MDHLEISNHLHDAGFETALRSTFLGQAHIAGTGPADKTCRECKHWFIMKRVGDGPLQPAPPGYYAKSDADHPLELKRARCNYVVAHKAKRRVPHDAKACRFFDPSESAPPVEKPTK